MIQLEVFSPIVLKLARQQTLDDVDRLRQALMTLPLPGQPAPTTCSFKRSPAPSPRVKRLSLSSPIVAAPWAMIAG
jgi:hypothetical protein